MLIVDHDRAGAAGASEIADVIDIVMRNPNVAPFISKILIQKLATENPSAGYVERVATVFARTAETTISLGSMESPVPMV